MTPEGRLVVHIKRVVAASGGTVRKCAWEGRVGAPDLLVMYSGCHWWIECKAPGKKLRVSQAREGAVMRRIGGCMVLTFDDLEAFDTWWSSAVHYVQDYGLQIGADAEVKLVDGTGVRLV